MIEAQKLQIADDNRQKPEILVRVSHGDIVLRTTISHNRNLNPVWNVDLMLTVPEPFEDKLVL